MDGISTINSFLTVHQPQLELSGVPRHFWPTLCKKLTDEIFDAGLTFSLNQMEYEDGQKQPYDPTWSIQVSKEGGINHMDEEHIYLIDHAWTFRIPDARRQLSEVPGLLERMRQLMGLSVSDDASEEEVVNLVYSNLWKYAQTYSININNITAEDKVPIWYIMDEVGSAIAYSDEPNFRTVPFIHIPDQVTYTLLFPIKDVEEGGFVYRNFIEGDYDEKYKAALLIPWREYHHYDEDFTQEEPDEEYFLSGHIEETLPTIENVQNLSILKRDLQNKIRVYSDYNRINENLTHPAFQISENEHSADILWFIDHFKQYKDLSECAPEKFINQFPFENILTIKDLLCVVGRRKCDKQIDYSTLETYPKWLPTTFNLKTELVKFVAYFHQRKLKGLDNHWICKPFNLARSLDTHITDELEFIVRLPLTGPKIIQKYIDDPVLFERPECEGKVKFDVRYVLLLKSVRPLEVYVYKNFFLRFANKPFALSNFDEYERHFTVMNYANPENLFRMLCADFVVEWGKQYPQNNWEAIERDIFTMIKELFESATSKPPPCGIAHSPQSRALYAADIMLAWETDAKGNKSIQPKLLEVNWMPDCNRACEYYPQFYNDIFSMFFLNQLPETCIKL